MPHAEEKKLILECKTQLKNQFVGKHDLGVMVMFLESHTPGISLFFRSILSSNIPFTRLNSDCVGAFCKGNTRKVISG